MSSVLELMHPDTARAGRLVGASRLDPSREQVPTHPWFRAAMLMLFDVAALCLSLGMAMVAVQALGIGAESLRVAGATVGLATVLYAVLGLYATFPQTPVKEVRSLSLASSLAFLVTAMVATAVVGRVPTVVFMLAAAWILTVPAVPLARAFARNFFGTRPWWSVGVVVLGAGRTGRRIVRILKGRPELGLRPVAVLDDDPAKQGWLEGVPVPGGIEKAAHFALERNIPYAIVAMPTVDRERLLDLLERHACHFQRILVVPDLFGFASLSVTARDFSGVLAFEVRDHLLNPWHQRIKRVMDFCIALGTVIALSPVFLLLALLVRLDSPGPVFFAQERVGRRGRHFKALKFRSMFLGADKRLEEVLARDPEAALEYATYRKLKNDPRVTRVGKWLRKLSLDELPQLFNVLKGEMSLVGPRPYLPSELSDMTGRERMILRTLPGITGLWQVLGRNDYSFGSRIDLDVHYVRNWSMALDLYLLARTIPTVLTSRGAS